MIQQYRNIASIKKYIKTIRNEIIITTGELTGLHGIIENDIVKTIIKGTGKNNDRLF